MDAHVLIAELAGFINRWPANDKGTWKRFRLAVTEEELNAIVDYYRKDNEDTGINLIAYALRGVPLVVEIAPMDPLITLVPQ